MQRENEVQHVFLVGAKSLGAYGGYETFDISSQSTTRTRKILNIMWRVKLTVTAAWMKQKWMV